MCVEYLNYSINFNSDLTKPMTTTDKQFKDKNFKTNNNWLEYM